MNLQIHSDTTEVFCSHFNWFAPLHNPISKNLVFFLSDVFEDVGRGNIWRKSWREGREKAEKCAYWEAPRRRLSRPAYIL